MFHEHHSIFFVVFTILLLENFVMASYHLPDFKYIEEEFYYPEFAPTSPKFNGTTNVSVQVEILNSALNERDWTMDMSITLILTWHDSRLSWKDTSQMPEAEFWSNIIWQPPFSLAFSHNPHLIQEDRKKEEELHYVTEVNKNGDVTMVRSYRFSKLPCYHFYDSSTLYDEKVICAGFLHSLHHTVRFRCRSRDNAECIHVVPTQTDSHGMGFNLFKISVAYHYSRVDADYNKNQFDPLYNYYSMGVIVKPTSRVNYYIFFMPSFVIASCIVLLFLTNPISEMRSLATLIIVAAIFALLSEIYSEKSVQMANADDILQWYQTLLIITVVAFLWNIIGRQLWMYELPKCMDILVEYLVLVFDKVAFLFLLPPDLTDVIKKCYLEDNENKFSNKDQTESATVVDSDISDSVRKSMIDWLKCVLVIDRILLFINVITLLICYLKLF